MPKLRRLDYLAVVFILLLGQNIYYTGSSWALVGLAFVLIAWTCLSD